MRKISGNIVRALISIGESGEPTIPACLADKQMAWHSLMCGNEPWEDLAKELSETDLAALIHGIVLYSIARNQSLGGSVSPVIVLFRCYRKRFPKTEPALSGWIVTNRVNLYEPFGSWVYPDARCYSEFLQESMVQAAKTERNIEQELQRQKRSAQIKRESEAQRATKNLVNAVRRGDVKAVKALLAKGADPRYALPPDGQSLVEYAEANGKTGIADLLRPMEID